MEMAEKITREELRELVERREVTIVHALPEAYFRKEHIAGSVQMDHERVAEQAPERLPDRDAAIVVLCANLACRNSEVAANRLIALGYTNVRQYAEGIADWIGAGLPVEGEVGAAA
jgi:rhodanese-related sulfurtransferase